MILSTDSRSILLANMICSLNNANRYGDRPVVLRVPQFVKHGQQFPARGERVPEPSSIRQHPAGAQDPHRSILRLLAWRHARRRRRPAHAPPLQHRAAGAPRLQRQPLATDRKTIIYQPTETLPTPMILNCTEHTQMNFSAIKYIVTREMSPERGSHWVTELCWQGYHQYRGRAGAGSGSSLSVPSTSQSVVSDDVLLCTVARCTLLTASTRAPHFELKRLLIIDVVFFLAACRSHFDWELLSSIQLCLPFIPSQDCPGRRKFSIISKLWTVSNGQAKTYKRQLCVRTSSISNCYFNFLSKMSQTIITYHRLRNPITENLNIVWHTSEN